ncbi:MAG: hypothetical protein QXO27_03250 [Candidatus Aenigmatarchaeota archaeon]
MKAKYSANKRSKKPFVLLIISSVAVGIFIWLVILKTGSQNQKCNELIGDLDNSSYYPSELLLSIPLESSLSTICSFSKIDEYVGSNLSFYNISSCNLDKIKNGLDNPNSLSLDDIQTYVKASIFYARKNVTNFLKNIYILMRLLLSVMAPQYFHLKVII